jgi:tetratricopeptide (TPR) repeat protein
MVNIRDFEPVLPDPKQYVEKALALYERALSRKTGRIVFIVAELGGGKTDLLNALAQALYRAKPKPNFLAGFFRDGEYRPQARDWEAKISLKKAVQAVGEAASLLGLFPGLYSFASSLIGQLFQTSASAYEFGNEFKSHLHAGKEGADWLRELLRRATVEKPLVCLIDNWDQAQRFYWDEMLLGCSREIANDLPLLLFLTVNGLIDLAAPEKDESGLTMVIKSLTEKGLAECWFLQKLSGEEITDAIGLAEPRIASRLQELTGGNPRWVEEVWREWRLNETVVMNEMDQWIWNPRHKPTITLYDAVLRDQLKRLVKARTPMAIEDAREVLAFGALEGVRFTADAVALALGVDRDELIDFFDETLVQSEDNPGGILLDEGGIKVTKPDGSTPTLWRYGFVSELHWLALERHGFAEIERPGKMGSERLEKTAILIAALREAYAPEERLAAVPLARLHRYLGNTDESQQYQRVTNYSANRSLMRDHALKLAAVKKDDWDEGRCGEIAKFLIEAGRVMINAFPHDETLTVLEEAGSLARRANSELGEAEAHSLSGLVFLDEDRTESARYSAIQALNIFERANWAGRIGNTTLLLAEIDFKEGRYQDAYTQAIRALKIYNHIDFSPGEAGALRLLARITLWSGDHDAARKYVNRALNIHEPSGDQEGKAVSLHILAQIDFNDQRYAAARSQMLSALELYKMTGSVAARAKALDLLAQIDQAEGKLSEARLHARESLEIDQELGFPSGVAYSKFSLAQVDYSDGHHRDALDGAIEALRVFEGINDQKGAAFSLTLLGSIAAKLHLPTEACELTALAILIFSETGTPGELKAVDELATLAAEATYSEQQIADLKQLVFELYKKDGCKELIENALAKLNEAASLKGD